ncbi:hydroxypyruvate isomerase family protein [Bacteroidota bacterium]
MSGNNNSRRSFIKKAAGSAAVIMAAPAFASAATDDKKKKKKKNLPPAPFNLKYAPSFGMFRESAGNDLIDQIKFCHDQGFRAIFDNGLMGREKSMQEKIAYELDRLGMDLGPFVLYADFSVTSFVTNDGEKRKMLINRMKEGAETARITGVKWALVVPGRYDERLHWDYQTNNVIDNLKFCMEILEPAGLTMVLEPLNTLRDHPGLFLTEMPQTYMIAKAVNNPYCKIVDDIYHQQITEGNIIPNIEYCYEEIAAFHLGDNPGRKEPTSGEINYKNIFKYLYNKEFDGVLCMEHGKSLKGIEGEKAVIQAYRECDAFLEKD